MKVRANSHFN